MKINPINGLTTAIFIAWLIIAAVVAAAAVVVDVHRTADTPGQYIGMRRVVVDTLPDGTRCAVVQATGTIDCDWAPRQAEASKP